MPGERHGWGLNPGLLDSEGCCALCPTQCALSGKQLPSWEYNTDLEICRRLISLTYLIRNEEDDPSVLSVWS